MRGMWSMGLGLALHYGACPLLERVFGPFTKAASTMVSDDDEITLTRAVRLVDNTLESNADKAAVREEHAIHRDAISALHRCAAEASKRGLTDLAKHYRDLATHADQLGEISLKLTAARAA